MNKKRTTNSPAKKAVKRTVKKTYAKKKTPPKARKFTLDEFMAVTAENHAKTEAAIRGLSATIEGLVEENKLTAASIKQTAALIKEQSKNLGSVSNDIGELMEFIVIPKIRLAMNAVGNHTFKTMLTERKLKKIDELDEKKTITEVDVLLYGDTEVMAVETKSHLVTRDVRKHIERLDILRQNEDLIDIKGKKLIGAVVGAIVDDGAKDLALEEGLYVVKIREEENKLDIKKPEQCKTW